MSGEHEDRLHDFSKLGARKSTNCFHRNKLATGVRSSTNHFHRTVLERQKIIYADNICLLRACPYLHLLYNTFATNSTIKRHIYNWF